jgi:hypothetical protein
VSVVVTLVLAPGLRFGVPIELLTGVAE